MTGDTVDSNSSMIAQKLREHGFDVDCKITVGDDVDQLTEMMIHLGDQYSLLLVNGGLGPTADDLTAEALAKLTKSRLRLNPLAEAHLEKWCAERGITVNEANRKQALLPPEATIIENPIGSAVGISVNYNNCLLLCTPGVPSELRLMLDEQIVPLLRKRFPQARGKRIRRLRLFGVGESALQQIISEEIPDWPESVTLGFRVQMPLVELKLETEPDCDPALPHECEKRLREVLGDRIIGENDQTMAEVLVAELEQRGRTITTAESCTGGLIAAEITRVPGASAVYEAGFVSYSNFIKHKVLGVSEAVLDEHGAVSEPVVLEMAAGALAKSGADYVVAVSGIAGPDGGSVDKPVGTVWIAWGSAENLRARQFNMPLGRILFQQMVAARAMDLVRRDLIDQ